ncbi:MAG: hypothetical protein ACPGSL_04990 [Vicingaceae bacterium]
MLSVCLITNKVNAQFYNGTHVGFGKNRVQYDYFEWKFYRYANYETYFYTGGKELAIYTAKVARKHIQDQEDFFEYELKDKIQFIIYNKQSHFKQSNVGLSLENGEVGGITNIMGSKVYIYFNGDHADFNRQIKEGIAQILVNQQVYGSNWRQVLRSTSLMTVPEWYRKGLTSYISDNWNAEIENSVRDGITSGKYKRFNTLSDKDAIIAGHSLWAYIVDTYGEAVIPNILYMSRITQSIEKGFLYVLGISMKNLTADWKEYYEKEYKGLVKFEEEDYLKKELFKIKKRRDYSEFKMSSDGNNFAYVTNKLGQYKIYIYYKDVDKQYKIYKKEFKLDRITDHSYPILEWNPTSEILAFVTEEKGVLLMHYFDVNTGGVQVKPLFKLEKVTAMDYADSGKEIVFSGVYKGQSDLYLYYPGPNSHKKITNDIYDDLEPRFIENDTKIVFTSNRTADSLAHQPTDKELFYNKKDVWTIDYLSKEKKLNRVTETPKISEKQPVGLDSMLYYLGEENRLNKRYSAVRDSFITHIDTSIHYYHFYDAKPAENFYNRSIIEHHINASENYTEILKDDFKYHLMERNLSEKLIPIKKDTLNTTLVNDKGVSAKESTQIQKAIQLKSTFIQKDTSLYNAIDIKNYVFENEKQNIQKQVIIVGDTVKKDSVWEKFEIPNQRNYNLSFFNDNSALKLSNSFVNGEYQQFTGGPYISPGIGATIKFATVDLFENYKIYGGVRLSSSTREYFMTYQNLVSRTDKEYTFSRTTSNQNLVGATEDSLVGLATNTLSYSLKYPFSEVASVRATFSGRNDNTVVKSISDLRLNDENVTEYRAITKIAFVFDNTRHKMTNIYYGTKFKLFAEYYQEFGDGSFISSNKSLTKDGDLKGRGNGENGNMQVVGLDFRHSLEINRELVWVNRFAASSSFGHEKLIYYLGSTDDWIPIDQDQFINEDDVNTKQVNYRYHALAANLRGFPQNIRRGTNFAVINSEIRFPVFKYFIKRPIRSKFVKNFQIIAFTDVGAAWSGLDPWGKQNTIDEDEYPIGPTNNPTGVVTVSKKIDPIVAGYGFGLRTTLLGYFLRFDWAWGVEDGYTKEKPIFYLSLSLDI